MKILCTICARGGSKGVKNKNIKLINKRPLISYTIKQAKKSKLFDKIVVSTDSKNIQKCAQKFGAESWFLRPKKLASDQSQKVPVIQHTLRESEKYFKKKFDIIIDLDVSSPLRNIQDIKKALVFFKKKKGEILMSGCKSRKNPYFNVVEITNGKLKRAKVMKKNIFRRQDAPKTYDCNASIYIWKRKSLLDFKTFYKSKTVFFIMPESRSWDIDTEFDFKIVEYLLKKNER